MVEFTEIKRNELKKGKRKREREATWRRFIGTLIVIGIYMLSMVFLGICITISMIRINIF